MLLAIDAGNTHTVFGLFQGERLKRTWRMSSTSGALRGLAKKLPSGIEAVIVSSVVPVLKSSFETLAERACGRKAVFVSDRLKMPIRIKLPHPKQLGQDRIVNAAAAYDRWKCGLIIVDLGTATTCDVVTPRGEYIGGTISPGIAIANEALHEKTALLPLVPIARPRRAVGRNTVEAIRSGVFYGYVGLIAGLVARIKNEIKFPAKVIATGGLSSLIGPACETIDVIDPNLTLKGLRLLHEANSYRA
jgi:type III pantothenate kinase